MMDRRRDFVEWLPPDASGAIIASLDDPDDFVRASAVSRTWRRFVIENSSCKKLVLRLHPETSVFSQVIEVNSSTEQVVTPRNPNEWEVLEKEHKIYAFLSHCLKSRAASQDCALQTIAASSTDNYPDERIEHTLEPSNMFNNVPSYWSSKGAKDPQVPETLTYRLNSNLYIVNQINISPFEAHFQDGCPIYSSQAVRFRMGHSRLLQVTGNADKPTASQQTSCDDYIWTYVSPIYPMLQEYKLQSFTLPRPVLCTGGILQIEFLGRVQQQDVDGLYYICVCHVQVLGRPLPSVLDMDRSDNPKQLALMYFPQAQSSLPNEEASTGEQTGLRNAEVPFGWNVFAERLRRGVATFRWNNIRFSASHRADIVDDGSDGERNTPSAL